MARPIRKKQIPHLQDAIKEARATQMRERIQQAVDDGTITQAHADWLFEGLEQGFIGGPDGFGFGREFKFGPRIDQTPVAEPTLTSE